MGKTVREFESHRFRHNKDNKMKVLDPGHTYEVNGGQTIAFIKRSAGELIWDGTTNEELLEVLINRTRYLDNKFPCLENKVAISNMESALTALELRTKKRVAQGVETKDIAHV